MESPVAKEIRISYSEDAAQVLSVAGQFLESRPVLHNVMLTLLHERAASKKAGRYWMGTRGETVVAVVFQSPLNFPVNVTPMDADMAAALVDAIASAGIALPGVNGDAASAAIFAGHWTERCKTAATPTEGQRIYEYLQPTQRVETAGNLRRAVTEERDLIVRWVRAFTDEVHHQPDPDVEELVSKRLSAGQVWVWDDGGAKSMAIGRDSAAGVVRVSLVYTPPEHRRHGYAAACVQELSESIRKQGHRCILYTDLSNPISNSVYRRIGYKAIAEALRYRFH